MSSSLPIAPMRGNGVPSSPEEFSRMHRDRLFVAVLFTVATCCGHDILAPASPSAVVR
jgi:hypothetical protein